ncbi:DeoR/GlpR family DNA-binding transcription regulator [Halocella sp. SP3-1]|uniref:DeoR/GlpR family DNA-binding transcription regulator n=1 Tax=Halocella sp. SP3-1 TaxID=2382161 RepID=UPI000F75A651|nr:DeoR/GlpR family DNA-binding transcription regulator [Halocella sp. SP3-1]AZO93914.1 DeoR/GlpR transcriptional regulator [Halocella sp. SP3-1]
MSERIKKIKKLLLEEKQIEVAYLSEQLGVTEVTIRRDLDKLEKEGFLKKTYGGAILIESPIKDNNLFQLLDNQSDKLREERESIVEIVLNIINDGEAIYLGNGPVSLLTARSLKKNNYNLTVLTNDLLIAAELYHTSGIKVVLPGGDLMSSSPVLVGVLAQKSLKEFYLQKAFVEAHGVDFEFGYSLNSMQEVEFVNKIINVSKETFMLADQSRYNQVAFSRLGDIRKFSKVISNIQIPNNYKEFFFNNNITLYNCCDFS